MNSNGISSIRAVLSQRSKPILWFATYRMYVPVICRYYNFTDKWKNKASGFERLPPPNLRYRVNGTPKIGTFLNQGKKRADGIESCLRVLGKSLDSFEKVLDFGCGCGRTIMWFAGKKVEFYGTDIDSEAIQWCRDNLKFAKFTVNDTMPPLAYEESMFDLIYAMSVFTHLDEYRQFQWLLELKRVLKEDGILIITVYDEKQQLEEVDELKYRIKNDKIGKVPSWYLTASRSRKYVLENYCKYFKIVGYGEAQDALNDESFVLLQK
jgi:2-polyprenyl-3-methyl-5-hydroxy-6-metoxy-1,4-benzoquinol methylase